MAKKLKYTDYRIVDENANWRRIKKIIRNETDLVYEAYNCGSADAFYGRKINNPYPKGKRHDAYNYGAETH